MTGWMWLFFAVTAIVSYVGGLCRGVKSQDELGRWRQACAGWRARAEAAERRLRRDRLAPVLPLTVVPSMAEQRHGLKVVQGGRR